ncbi:MAG: SRPBCC domain-containing protein [Solirubrobacterales bacterium]|nr:SRPBCC domain-containing protein [Solirubrobacterales bacterium]
MTSQPSPRPVSRREVRITRLLRAPRELVFRAWIDPDQIAAWWAPNDYEIPSETVEIDPRVGGRIHFSMVERAGEAVYPVRFEIVEISEPELLVLASDPQPEIGLVYPMITRAVFEAGGDGTLVTVTQGPHAEETQGGATAGWTESLDKLESHLRRSTARRAVGT